jgi:hypothetical protein
VPSCGTAWWFKEPRISGRTEFAPWIGMKVAR